MSYDVEKMLSDAGMIAPREVAEAVPAANPWAEADEVLSGRPDALKFENEGDTFRCTIGHNVYTRQKRKFGADANSTKPEDLIWWDDGRPKMEAVYEVDVDGVGLRTLYLSSWRLENAISQACRAAGVRGLRPGGKLVLRWTSSEDVYVNNKKTDNAAKVYDAAYEPPGRKPLDVTNPRPVEQVALPDMGEPPF